MKGEELRAHVELRNKIGVTVVEQALVELSHRVFESIRTKVMDRLAQRCPTIECHLRATELTHGNLTNSAPGTFSLGART